MRWLILLLIPAIAYGVFNRTLSIGSSALDTEAIFQVNSTSKGSIACPVMTTAQKNAIASPTEGLCVYDSNTAKLNYYNGGSWVELEAAASAQDLQSAYDNSSGEPEITLDGTRNGLAIRDNATPIGVDLFQVQDNGGNDLFDVSASLVRSNTEFRVVSTSNFSVPCPSMTEAQRDALATPVDGSCVYNTTTDQLNVYDGATWNTVGSGTGLTTVTKSSSTTLATSGEENVLCDTSGGNVVLGLPATSGNGNVTYRITKISTDANQCIIDPNAAETLDGKTTRALQGLGAGMSIANNASNWFTYAHSPSVVQTNTPTINWTGSYGTDGRWHQDGQWLHYQVRILPSGAVAGGDLTITLPFSLSVDESTSMPLDSLVEHPGSHVNFIDDSAADRLSGVTTRGSATTVNVMLYVDSSTTGYEEKIQLSSGWPIANNDDAYIYFKLPISGW